jgi:hypothetical protein
MRMIAACLVTCLLLPISFFIIEVDKGVAASRSAVFELIFISFGVAIGAAAFLIGRHKAFLVLPSVYILFLIALPFIDLSPVKPALRAGDDMRPGMNAREVIATIDRHFPEGERFRRPEMYWPASDRLRFVIDPDDGRYNAAFLEVDFANGKCIRTRFLPD